jgi:hypothetical protein
MGMINMKDSERLKISGDMFETIMTMVEENHGAATVIKKMERFTKFWELLLHLDDMNIRGSQIWIAYKDYAGQDLFKFKEAVETRSQDMVNIVNKECPDNKAVTSGGSFLHKSGKVEKTIMDEIYGKVTDPKNLGYPKGSLFLIIPEIRQNELYNYFMERGNKEIPALILGLPYAFIRHSKYIEVLHFQGYWSNGIKE